MPPAGNLGIGNNLIGGGDALRAALSRRRLGGNVPLLSQVGGGAPSMNTATFPTPPTNLPNRTPAAAMGPTPPMQAPQEQNPIFQESSMIVRALDNRLKALSGLLKVTQPTQV